MSIKYDRKKNEIEKNKIISNKINNNKKIEIKYDM